jgi:hypothetical protein
MATRVDIFGGNNPEQNSGGEVRSLSETMVSVASKWYEDYSMQIKKEDKTPTLEGFVDEMNTRQLYSALGEDLLSRFSTEQDETDANVLYDRANEMMCRDQNQYDGPFYDWFPKITEGSIGLCGYGARDSVDPADNYVIAARNYEEGFQDATRNAMDIFIASSLCREDGMLTENIGRTVVAALVQTHLLQDLASMKLSMAKTMLGRSVSLHAWQNRQDQISTGLLLGGAVVGVGTSVVIQATENRLPPGSVYAVIAAGTIASLFAGHASKLWTKVSDGFREKAHRKTYLSQQEIGDFLKVFEEVGGNIIPKNVMTTIQKVNQMKVEACQEMLKDIGIDLNEGSKYTNALQNYLLSDLYTQSNVMMAFDRGTINTSNNVRLWVNFAAAIFGTFAVNYAAAHIDTAHIIQLIQGR